jgi:hypothetical protein
MQYGGKEGNLDFNLEFLGSCLKGNQVATVETCGLQKEPGARKTYNIDLLPNTIYSSPEYHPA